MTSAANLGWMIEDCSPRIVAEAVLAECDHIYRASGDIDRTLVTFAFLINNINLTLNAGALLELDACIDDAFDSGTHDDWYADESATR